MSKNRLYISEKQYRSLRKHLFRGEREQVAFLFARSDEDETERRFRVRKTYEVPPEELDFHSAYHISLTEAAWAKVIKTAWDLDAIPIEVHSHRDPRFAPGFSGTDFEGFAEAVPHMRWRLRGRPYVALVFCPSGFDGLVWRGKSGEVEAVDALVVDGQLLRPSGLSIKKIHGKDGQAKV